MSEPRISRDEFIKCYCERAGKSWETLQEFRAVVRCRCDYDGCEGWAMVPYSCVDDYEPGGMYYEDGDPAPYPRTALASERLADLQH